MNTKSNRFAAIFTVLILLISFGFTSCKNEDDTTPIDNSGTPGDTTMLVPLSTMDKLTNVWQLHQTFRNGVETSSGTVQNYEFTRDGAFKFEGANGWENIAAYSFYQDSTAINVLFIGLNNSIRQELTVLDEHELHTSFVSGGNNFLYKYRR